MPRKIDKERVEASRRRLRNLAEEHPEAFERLGDTAEEIAATLVSAAVLETDDDPAVADDEPATVDHEQED